MSITMICINGFMTVAKCDAANTDYHLFDLLIPPNIKQFYNNDLGQISFFLPF